MAAGFSITISAVDGASARIDAVNKRLAAMRAPAERLQKSFNTFSKLSGIKQVGDGLQRVAGGAQSAFQSIARIVTPLSAITGAASIAGMYRMVEAWGQWGSQLGFTAQRIGLSAEQLQTFQGAALIAGTSTGAMTSGLQALGQSMYDAIGGRAPATVALLNQLGVAFDDSTHHARSVAAVLPELADKIAAIKDPYTQARVATQLFGGAAEEMLPFLRRGAQGIADLEERQRRYGVTSASAVAAANRMREAQANLTLAVQGLGNSIAERLVPIVAPLLDQMANWIALNRTWIAQGIGDRVKEMADFLGTIDLKIVLRDMGAFWHTADGIAQSLGGWKTVLEGLVAVKFASFVVGMLGGINPLTAALVALTAAYIANDIAYENYIQKRKAFKAADQEKQYLQDRINGLTPERRAKFDALQRSHGGQVMDGARAPNSVIAPGSASGAAGAIAYFQAQGWSRAQAAGMAANIQAESGYNSQAVGDGGAAFGIGQWHADRQANFAKWAGHDIRNSTYQEQLGFYNYELTGGQEQGAGRRLRGAQTAAEAGSIVSRYDERPAAADEEAANRGTLASQLADAAQGAPGATGKVEVVIRTPAGTQTVARATGNVNAPKIVTTSVGAESGV